MAPKLCRACRRELGDLKRFCPSCGAKQWIPPGKTRMAIRGVVMGLLLGVALVALVALLVLYWCDLLGCP